MYLELLLGLYEISKFIKNKKKSLNTVIVALASSKLIGSSSRDTTECSDIFTFNIHTLFLDIFRIKMYLDEIKKLPTEQNKILTSS